MGRRFNSQQGKSLISIVAALGCSFAVMISCGGSDTINGNNGVASDTSATIADTTKPVVSIVPPSIDSTSLLAYIDNSSPWVDSVFATLSEDEKIAQLFTVPVYPYKDGNAAKIKALLEKQLIGGLIMMKGGPVITASLINEFQETSRVPLLVSTDAEWGVKMRMDSVIRFPYQLTLGAMKEHDLVYEMGKQIAWQHQRLGIHVNFAPVVDINNNANNPVIGMRSFGEDKYNVTAKGWAYVNGLQDQKVLAIAKHFPGHGDTDVDSHFDLPVISHDIDRLMDIEMYPFRCLVDSGLGGLMTTHLYVPALDSTKNLAAGLSQPTVEGILREKLGFRGIIYTDALNMKGVTKHFPNGEIDVRALMAGNDMLLMPLNVETSIAAVKKAIEEERLTWAQIDEKVKKILAVKHWAGLNDYKPTSTSGLIAALNDDKAKALNQQLADAYVTLLIDSNANIPVVLDSLKDKKVAMVTLGGPSNSTLRKLLESKVDLKHISISKSSSSSTVNSVVAKLKAYDYVIIALHASGFRPKNNYGISSGMSLAVQKLAAHPNTTLVLFCDAYGIGKLKNLTEHEAVILAYQNTEYSAKSAYKVMIGEIEATGTLPVSVNDEFKVGMSSKQAN
jgi:beta-N-acetylhexosaminidase